MEYRNNRPFVPHGLEVDRVCFSGGRLAADIARHGGITNIKYFGGQRLGDVNFFQADMISAWALLFRPMILIDGIRRYALEFRDTTFYPAGYISHCEFEDVKLRHEMWLANEELIFRLNILSNPGKLRLEFQLINTDICTRIDKPTRSWKRLDYDIPFFEITDHYPDDVVAAEKKAGYLTLAQRGDNYVPQVQTAVTHFAVSGSGNIELTETPRIFRKHYYSLPITGTESFFILGFGHKGAAELKERLDTLCATEEKAFAIPTSASPKVSLDKTTVNSFLMNAGDILDSIKVKDIKGGMRAADSGYWIWGWDSMVFAEALGFLNQSGYLVEMLEFYRRTADPVKGIFHEMTTDERPHLSMAYPAQCLYAVMLYWAYVFDGDRKILKEYMPFAMTILERASAMEVGGSGLISGVSLYPDHPEDLEQDGHDLSVFNNSIYYQALRVMEVLACENGDIDTGKKYADKAERARKAFANFYDHERHYFYDSLSSADFTPRKHYPVYAILHVTRYAADLAGDQVNQIAAFMDENFSAKQGARILPLSDSRYIYDGNQLGMYMPATERFYREMQSHLHPEDAIAKFYSDIEWNWARLTLPEALTCEYENHGLTPDNPGRKQSFTIKSWVSTFYGLAAGIRISPEGLHFQSTPASGISIEGLLIRGHRINFVLTGGKGKIRSLHLNGREIVPADFIGFYELDEVNDIALEKNEI